jgi:hypothetical protein
VFSGTSTRFAHAAAKKRLACVYVPHGVILDQWTPATSGSDFELKPILKPLEPFRQSMVVVTNLTRPERGFDTNHAGAPSSFLTGVPPKRTAGPDFSLGATLDQVVAKAIGQETTLPSLELATEDFTGLIGDCSPGYSCAYVNTLSWQDATTPLPMEINPRVAFERLFGGGTTREARLARLKTDTRTWVERGWISADAAQNILGEVAARPRLKAAGAASTIGAVLLAMGVILFVASNWGALDRYARLGVLMVGLWGSLLVAQTCRNRGYPILCSALGLVVATIFGAGSSPFFHG